MDDKTVIETIDRTMLESLTGIRSTQRGWLTVWNGALRGRDFPVYDGRNFVGADRKCSICLTDIHFPDFVFNIRIHDNVWTLIDLDSDGGLILNDEPVFRKELHDEDWIKVANTLFRVKFR